MREFKRAMALLLTLVMIISMMPVRSSAAEPQAAPEMDNGDVTVEGTNSFGSLLTEAITEEQESTAEAEAGYTLTDLVIEGNTATVTYDSMEEAILVVALYTEDGMQLVTSGKTIVTPDATEATVTIDGDVPYYFLLKAFLLDIYDNSPLCPAYESPMYTQDMQDLLDARVEDYDSDRVLNLDEDNTTNFAVYADGTIVMEETAGINTVVSADDDNLIYVFENADENITALTRDSIVVYHYGDEEMLIFKVDTISTDGTTATVQGKDLELDEVFSIMKIESTSDPSNTTIDTSETDESITYEGTITEEPPYGPTAIEDTVGAKLSYVFKIDKKESRGSDDSLVQVEASIKGSLEFSAAVKLNFYISTKRQFIEFKVDTGAKLGVTIAGELNINAMRLGDFKITPIWGVNIHLAPRLKISFSGEVSLSATLSFTLGFSVEHRKGGNFQSKNLCTTPKLETELKFEGKIFFGIDLHPGISIVSKSIAKADLTSMIGFEVTGEVSKNFFEEPDTTSQQVHACKTCMDGDISFVIQLSLDVQFLKSKRLKLSATLCDKKFKITDFYYSYDREEFGWGVCPYFQYRIWVHAMNRDESDAAGVQVSLVDGKKLGTTNSSGILDEIYLERGNYTFTANIEGQPVSTTEFIYAPGKVVLTASESYWERRRAQEKFRINPDSTATGSVKDSDPCGPDLEYTLFESGLLVISGTGEMDSYSSASDAPWYEYRDKIKTVEVRSGVTSISAYAFYSYPKLSKVLIADTVTAIGSGAFGNCTGLKEIKLPVDYPLSNSFYGCSNVTKLHYTQGQTGIMTPRDGTRTYDSDYYQNTLEYICRDSLKSVYFDENITAISEHAFHDSSMTTVVFSEATTSLGDYAFYSCDKLTTIELPPLLTSMGMDCFAYCSGLAGIEFPATLASIPTSAFYSCTGLTELVIPDTVTHIEGGAFVSCTGLTKVTMPVDLNLANSFYGCTNVQEIHYTYGRTGIMTPRDGTRTSDPNYYLNTLEYICRYSLKTVTFDEGITKIAEYAFYDTDLTTVKLPSTLEAIDRYAFCSCDQLTTIQLPEGLTSMGMNCFAYCPGLTEIEFPASLASIPVSAFYSCTGLTELVIPDTVTHIEGGAFVSCTGLTKVTMPVDLNLANSFSDCTNVEEIHYTYGRTGIMTPRDGTRTSDPNYYLNTLEYICRYSLKTVTFDEGITKIAEYAFYDTDLTTVKLPSTLTAIDRYAFYSCDQLATIELPQGLTSMGMDCFAYCSGLTEIEFPASLASIPVSAFYSCTGLTELVIPDTVTSISGSSFGNCTGLTKVTMPVDLNLANSFSGCTNVEEIHYTYGRTGIMTPRDGTRTSDPNYYLNTLEYICRYSLKTVTFDEGITKIAEYAFYDTDLTTVKLPSTLEAIDRYAFYSCDQLTTIQLPEGLTSMGMDCFAYCSGLTEIEFPASLASIPVSAFYSCTGLTELVIPDTVTSISGSSFGNCTGLTKVTMPVDLNLASSFSGCTNVEEIRYTYGQTGIMTPRDGTRTSDPNYYLNTLEYICRYSLKTVTFDEGITKIAEYAFYEANLTQVKLPSTLEAIDRYAFYSCDQLKELVFLGDAPSISNSAFYYDTLTAYYPAENETWTESLLLGYGGTLTWTPYTLDENGEIVVTGNSIVAYTPAEQLAVMAEEIAALEAQSVQEETAVTEAIPEESAALESSSAEAPAEVPSEPEMLPTVDAEVPSADAEKPNADAEITPVISGQIDSDVTVSPDAVYGGENDTDIGETRTIQTTTFTGLAAGKEYVIMALISLEAEDLLAPENILYIDQAVAEEDGTLIFQYIQRVQTDIFYVFACGASHKDLHDAVITFPEMTANGETQLAKPQVAYDGEILTEYADYVIVDGECFTKGGTYTCYIRGIHNYTGLVECTYTVEENVTEVANGWSGYTTWVLTDDGVLTFSGEGNMKNYGYDGGQPWLAYADQIKSVVIEKGVTAVGTGAFMNLPALESVTLPESGLTKIGEAAFYGCTALKEIYIPDGVYTIWAYTFKGCSALTEVRLPKTLIKIDQGAFENCTALDYVYIPGETEIIGSWSFKGCTGLKEADMQWADATEIREGAFKNCSALTRIYLPANIQVLGDSAFYGIGAKTFTVPATVTEVGPWCFARASLTEIIFEGNAPTIGEGAFNKITLTAYYPSGNATWTSAVKQNYGGNVTWKAN